MENPCPNSQALIVYSGTIITGLLTLSGALLKAVLNQSKKLQELAQVQSQINERLLTRMNPNTKE